ncbi:hypothetical protein ANN_10130 [Periplaneta americana]|uniref:Uncharacterized protein n=1 Tax=Periplaneta americana TaxID=6978 RepID=A0ABQ8TPA0_PERAM|nr:hypothetical protein ANN_10130 [Periplaneta americana]
MDLREMRYDDRDWINLAQDRDRWRAYFPNEIDCAHWKLNQWRGEHLGKSQEMKFKDSTSDVATGVAQSVKALACRSEVALRRGFYPAWADYLVGFLRGFPQPCEQGLVTPREGYTVHESENKAPRKMLTTKRNGWAGNRGKCTRKL